MPHITGVFSDPDDAKRAFDDLLALKFTSDDISVLMNRHTREHAFGDGDGAVAQNARAGAAAGGALGAAVGAALAAGVALAVGGLVVAAGPIALIGATIASTTAVGGIVGALVRAGIPDDDHGNIERALERGDIVLSVDSDEARADTVRKVLHGHEDVTPAGA